MKFSGINTDALDALKSARVEVDMSEFWGEGTIVYGRPVRPIDHTKVARDPKCKGWPEKFSMDGSVYLAMLVAQDQNGDPFFDNMIKDRPAVMKMPQEVVAKLVAGLTGSDEDDDPAKN